MATALTVQPGRKSRPERQRGARLECGLTRMPVNIEALEDSDRMLRGCACSKV